MCPKLAQHDIRRLGSTTRLHETENCVVTALCSSQDAGLDKISTSNMRFKKLGRKLLIIGVIFTVLLSAGLTKRETPPKQPAQVFLHLKHKHADPAEDVAGAPPLNEVRFLTSYSLTHKLTSLQHPPADSARP